jgi:hypothetical protein
MAWTLFWVKGEGGRVMSDVRGATRNAMRFITPSPAHDFTVALIIISRNRANRKIYSPNI